MTKRLASLLAVAGFLAFTTPAAAQLYVQGGPTIPTSTFGDFANTGWMGLAGYMFGLGEGSISIGPEVYYGSNGHEGSGDKTNLLGANAAVTVVFGGGEDAPVTPYLMGTIGILSHQFSPETGDNETDSGVSFGGAAGLGIGSRFFVEGRFMTASPGEEESPGLGNTTAIFGVFAGVVIG